jgi:hypothetical protein
MGNLKQIVNVGFAKVAKDPIFQQVQKNSGELKSLKEAVLAGANTALEAGGVVPILGAKWKYGPQKYNVLWQFVGSPEKATTVDVTRIAPA